MCKFLLLNNDNQKHWNVVQTSAKLTIANERRQTRTNCSHRRRHAERSCCYLNLFILFYLFIFYLFLIFIFFIYL